MTTEYQKQLAWQLAEALDDHHAMAFHLSNVKQFSEDYLRDLLTHVMSLPDHKVRNRARLFTHLIKNGYVPKKKYYSGD